MRRFVVPAALLGLALLSCSPAKDAVAIRVVVQANAPLDCIRVTASDENQGPPVKVEFPAPVGPGTSRTFAVAVYRHPDWGKVARLFAQGMKGGCDATVVSQSAPASAAFAGRGEVQVVTLTLDGVDADQDGYVGLLPDGGTFDCADTDPRVHPEADEPCDSPVDRDCDQARGCERPACLGQKDSGGLRCCPSGPSSGIEAACADGQDDDCDGLSDCADPDCQERSCDAFGRSCSPAGTCACPGEGSVELRCDDGKDDDCDGLSDCADPDCGDKACGAGRCLQGNCCVLGADGGVSVGAEQCGDGLDNDCNGATDCAEPACAGKPAGAGKVCCGAKGAPVEATESDCTNGVDDDCDGLADCADLDCNAKACDLGGGQGGVCSAFGCRGESCQNLVDDSGDGLADCADPLCAGKSCAAHGQVCAQNLCTCPAGPLEGDAPGECGDGLDNDCDGLNDCADSSCNGFTCAAGKICQKGSCACALSEPSEVSCANGADDDCDGLADCADPDCASHACGPGGGVCSGGACTCSTSAEAACANGADDDCDGLSDCADPDCAAQSCGGFGRVCSGSACSCPGGGLESCSNGADDDCDGLVDCADSADCTEGAACGSVGRQCTSGACQCRAGQSPELACNDGVDNDCDGLFDCADPDCGSQACGPFGQFCSGSPAACTCPSATESCSDGVDNDCDGLVDCADPGSCAAGASCGSNGKACSANRVCLCPSGQSREATCANGTDDDCDGLADCADPDCAGALCSGNSQSFCCGTSCTPTNTQGNCGYCSATCASGQSCQAFTGTSIVDCTCATAADCLPGERCHAFPDGARFCVECESDADCPSGRPTCSTNSFLCTCPPGASCSPQCTSDAQCSGAAPKCDVALTRCVGCLSAADCASGQSCVNLSCL